HTQMLEVGCGVERYRSAPQLGPRVHALLHVVNGMHDHERQPHDEGRSLAITRARGSNRSAMELDQMTHDRQPEAETAEGPLRGWIRLPEAIEHMRQELGRNPLAGVD